MSIEAEALQTCTAENTTTYSYDYGAVHGITWIALAEWLLPFVFFRVIEKGAYYRYFGYLKESNPITELWAPVTTEHYTLNVKTWYNIMLINAGVWFL